MASRKKGRNKVSLMPRSISTVDRQAKPIHKLIVPKDSTNKPSQPPATHNNTDRQPQLAGLNKIQLSNLTVPREVAQSEEVKPVKTNQPRQRYDKIPLEKRKLFVEILLAGKESIAQVRLLTYWQ